MINTLQKKKKTERPLSPSFKILISIKKLQQPSILIPSQRCWTKISKKILQKTHKHILHDLKFIEEVHLKENKSRQEDIWVWYTVLWVVRLSGEKSYSGEFHSQLFLFFSFPAFIYIYFYKKFKCIFSFCLLRFSRCFFFFFLTILQVTVVKRRSEFVFSPVCKFACCYIVPSGKLFRAYIYFFFYFKL